MDVRSQKAAKHGEEHSQYGAYRGLRFKFSVHTRLTELCSIMKVSACGRPLYPVD